ncbi:MAG: LacI family DNA-binding transcriptional regulator [Clostridia bacterium]|nr:LacI family DNA-binding transcriptional regulator [Clostridia bacterium]
MSTPKLKTIAENLGLSIGTVQRALHDKGGYSEETRERILREAERIGYTANAAASALRRSPITLGVLLPRPEGRNTYFFQYLWQGIDRALRDLSIYRIELVRCFVEPGSPEYAEALQALLDRPEPIDGLITVSRRDERADRLIDLFLERETPVFIINSVYDPRRTHPMLYAINANRHIGHLGADIFSAIHRGSQGKLLLLGGDRKNRLQVERSSDFCQRVGEECPEISILETHYYHDLTRLNTVVREYLEKLDDIVGIYAVSARETLTACQAVATAAKDERPTLVGTDAFPELLPFFENGVLTASVYQYPAKQSYMAVQMLISAIVKTPLTDPAERFPIVPVFRSTAQIFCDPVGMI